MPGDAGHADSVSWTLLTSRTDLAIVIPRVSARRPTAASVVTPNAGGPIELRLGYPDGSVRTATLARASEAAEAAVTAAASVVIVEEDATAPNGRRYAYVAVVEPPPAPGRQR
jgi:hypothetical protein